MVIHSIDDFDFNNQKVLLRADLNTVIESGKVKLSDRMIASAKTIKELLKKNAGVVILAHQGRPGKEDYMNSLNEHAKLLSKYVKVRYVDDVIGDVAVNAIKELKPGNAILLSNVRSLKEEFEPLKKKNILIKTLSPLFDIYVNDAFSVSHRKQTSVVGFAKKLPSCMGRLMEKEIDGLKHSSLKKHPVTYILAGFKPDDNIKLMESALKDNKVDNILTAGLFGQLCLVAKGYDLGTQKEFLEHQGVTKILPKLRSLIKKYSGKIKTPKDLAIDLHGKRKELNLNEFPSKFEVFDIGPKTLNKYLNILRKSNAIYMKGPTGYYHERRFSKSTKKIMKYIEKSNAYILIGGGHTVDALNKFRIRKKKINHITLSGGASIRFLAGEKLPGIEVLKC